MENYNEQYNSFLYTLGKLHSSTPLFVDGRKLPAQGFTSLYAVDEATAKAITTTGSTRQFKGVVWSQRLWMDIDNYQAAERAERSLKDMALDFVAYDSGGKGAHFGIMRDNAPSHLLPSMDKQWVKAHFPEADTSIYTHLHLFRLAGSVHESTGRKKELVTEHFGNAIVVPPVDFKDNTEIDLGFNTVGKESLFNDFRIMSETIAHEKGDRHYGLVKLTYALRDAGANEAVAMFWLGEVNKMYDERKDEASLEKIVRSIYTK